MSDDLRRALRVDSLNLVYVGITENDQIVKQAIGRTLNVSESGILLETHFAIDAKVMVSLSLALEDELINLNGEVVYSRSGKDGKYETGIKFLELTDESLQTLRKYIEAFRAQV